MLSDIDEHNKPQPQSLCAFMQISLCIILLTQNSIPFKIGFPWSQFPTVIVVISHLNKCI